MTNAHLFDLSGRRGALPRVERSALHSGTCINVDGGYLTAQISGSESGRRQQ